MDDELNQTKVGKSFARLPAAHPLGAGDAGTGAEGKEEGEEGEGEEGGPEATGEVNLDLNLLQNLLNSCDAQEGMPGPFSNLLGELGLDVPTDVTAAIGKLEGRG